MAIRADDDTVDLTDFHTSPAVHVDRSQAGPVVLTRHGHPVAAVVSARWFDRAKAALAVVHGNRRVYGEGTFPNDFAARLDASLPDDAALAADRWDHDARSRGSSSNPGVTTS